MPISRPQKERIPPKLRPFVSLGFNYSPARTSGKEAYGTCPLCEKDGKFYVNTITGQYSCKFGKCAISGNIFTLLEAYWKKLSRTPASRELWNRLQKDRGIPAGILKSAGIVWDGDRWIIPVRNVKGSIVNFRFYKWGKKLIGLPELETYPLGMDALTDASRKGEPVYVVEGEWDAFAVEAILDEAEEPGIVIGLPGAGAFKDDWLEHFRGRNVIHGFDFDIAGFKGLKRTHDKLTGVARSQRMISWPDSLSDGYDFRDFYNDDGTFEAFRAMITDYREPELDEELEQDEVPAEKIIESFPSLDSGERVPFREVLDVYAKWLMLSPDLVDAIRVTYAVIISNQLDGDPVWLHLAASPGFGKTEILNSCSACSHVVMRSTVTAHSLVSGFQLSGGRDPSLIPQLFGKTLCIKDFTEILGMPKVARDEIYSIIRGAYDGRIEKTFGNGVRREYRGYFSIITGVTPKIFGERGSVVGERFLVFHLPKKPDTDMSDIIMAALMNVGGESEMKEEIAEKARQFLEFKIEASDVPQIPREILLRIAALAQVVSMLRGTIEKDYIRDHVSYRPEYEVGTRPAKQLAKIAIGIALQNNKGEPINWEDIYRVVKKVGKDSCIGWNYETLDYLTQNDGQLLQALSKACNIPITTLANQLEELEMLGVVTKGALATGVKGRRPNRYWISNMFRKHWLAAGFEIREAKLRKPRLRFRQMKGETHVLHSNGNGRISESRLTLPDKETRTRVT